MTEVLKYSVCVCVDVEEKGVRMKLTVIDTPGFGDQINNENWYVIKILHYIECLNSLLFLLNILSIDPI